MDPDKSGGTISELRRREIFLALVTAQDEHMEVAQSRRWAAERFGVTEKQIVQIEREGIDKDWPPL